MLEIAAETELTRAARGSISNADKILDADDEFEEADFQAAKARQGQEAGLKKQATGTTRKKARKAERQRKAKGRKRK